MLEVSIDYAIKPSSGQVWVDNYWIIRNDCILFYGRMASPQCNTNKKVSEHLLKNSKMYDGECIVTKIHQIYRTSCNKFLSIERKIKR